MIHAKKKALAVCKRLTSPTFETTWWTPNLIISRLTRFWFWWLIAAGRKSSGSTFDCHYTVLLCCSIKNVSTHLIMSRRKHSLWILVSTHNEKMRGFHSGTRAFSCSEIIYLCTKTARVPIVVNQKKKYKTVCCIECMSTYYQPQLKRQYKNAANAAFGLLHHFLVVLDGFCHGICNRHIARVRSIPEQHTDKVMLLWIMQVKDLETNILW